MADTGQMEEMTQMADMSQMADMTQMANMTQVTDMSQMADMTQIEQNAVSEVTNFDRNLTEGSLSESITFTANETNTESIGLSQNPGLCGSNSPLAEVDVSCTQRSIELTQVTCESSSVNIAITQPSPTRSSPSQIEDFDQKKDAKPVETPLNSDKQLSEIRKAVLVLTKMRTVPYITLRKNLLSILALYNKLSQSERTELTIKNQLSSSFLKLFPKLFECPTLNNDKLHDLFKVGINCYVMNFKYFTRADRSQFSILFQFIFDLIFVNVKIKSYGKESYFLWIQSHKVKNQLTAASNKTQVQILLYYLIQLMFLLIETRKEEKKLSDKFYFDNQLRKLLAFLILNGNPDLLRIFRHSRSSLFKT